MNTARKKKTVEKVAFSKENQNYLFKESYFKETIVEIANNELHVKKGLVKKLKVIFNYRKSLLLKYV